MKAPERRSIIVWSGDWTATTGQAIVTRRVIERQIGIEWVTASYGHGGLRSIVGMFGAVMRLCLFIPTGKTRTVYLVCSRSVVGFLRDVPALLTAFFGARVVVHVHGSDLNEILASTWLGALSRALYDRCEIIIPSRHLINDLRMLTRAPVHVCENFVPMEPDQLMHMSDQTQDGPLIVWNANIMASKGFFDLVKAVRLARKNIPGLRLTALGVPVRDGEMKAEEARDELNKLLDESWFTYIGSVSPEDAFRWTAMSDLYVYPSRKDCQPLALMQAMCLAKPIIANDIPSLRATLGDYPSKLLPAPVPSDLAQAIEKMVYEVPSAELKIAAAQARERFSSERFDRFMSLILDGKVC
jgi:glycosyltransferase involved in cell wall biosynthesis